MESTFTAYVGCQIVPFRHRITIRCPICLRDQRMERKQNVWFPVSPFCCDIMRNGDTPEWNALLDRIIEGKLHES